MNKKKAQGARLQNRKRFKPPRDPCIKGIWTENLFLKLANK